MQHTKDNLHFDRCEPLRELQVINTDIQRLEREMLKMLNEVTV